MLADMLFADSVVDPLNNNVSGIYHQTSLAADLYELILGPMIVRPSLYWNGQLVWTPALRV